MAHHPFSSNTSRTALVGVLSAGAIAVLWFASLSPSGRVGLAAAAGLFPLAAVLAAGRGAGYFCWATVSILGMILLPDKGLALLFLLLFGLYPVLKSRFEQSRGAAAGWLLKLIYFNGILALSWFVFRSLFLPNLPGWLENTAMIWAGGNAVFILYDIGLTRLIFGLFHRLSGGRRG